MQERSRNLQWEAVSGVWRRRPQRSGVVRGGGPPRVSPFWGTPYYEEKSYLYWFVVKISFPFSFGTKTNQFSGKDLFVFVLDFTFLGRKRTNLTAMTFFCFCFSIFTYFRIEKGWHHEILPLLLPSLATPLPHRLKILHFFFHNQLNFRAILIKNNAFKTWHRNS